MSVLRRSLLLKQAVNPTVYFSKPVSLFSSKMALAQLSSNLPPAPLIGIDMGTAFCRVGVLHSSKVEILPNWRGNISTPAVVAFTETECLVGDEAKEQAGINPENTVYDMKRLIGRPYTEVAMQEFKRHWPFALNSSGQHPKVQVRLKGQKRELFPEQIYSMLLSKMKDTAEAHLGTRVTDAVVTVPASFNHLQRESVRLAGRLANLNVVRVINESTAAGVAFALQKKQNPQLGGGAAFEGDSMVVHFGGGHVSVTIMNVDGGIVEVKSTAGDDNVGGVDFDNRIEDFLMAEIKSRSGVDVSGNARAVAKVRFAAETVKRKLTTSDQDVRITIESLLNGVDFETSLNRAQFEEFTADLFYKTLVPIERCLHYANMERGQIGELILVGGSSMMPRFQALVKDFFGGAKLSFVANAETAIVTGAAAQAAILSGQKYELTQDMLLLDVAPFSLGVELPTGEMGFMIKKNSTIPTKVTQPLRTTEDEQRDFVVKVFEGEKTVAKENTFLGTAELFDLKPTPRGAGLILLTFTLDCSDNLSVHLAQRGAGIQSTIELTNGHCDFTAEEMDRMLIEADEYRTQEDKAQRRFSAWRALEISAFNAKDAIQQHMQKLAAASAEVEAVIDWLEKNPEPLELDCRRQEELLNGICAAVLTPTAPSGRNIIVEKFNPEWFTTSDVQMQEAA